MSHLNDAGDIDAIDGNRDVEWLQRNAQQVQPKQLINTDSWDRAKSGRRDADVENLIGDPDLFKIELPDGDPHLTLFVTHTDDAHAGACSCEGYLYNRYCAHLFVLAQLDVTDNILRTDDRRAGDLLEGSVEQPDPDVQEYDDQDDGPGKQDGQGTDTGSISPDEAVPVESSASESVEPQGTDTQNRSARPSTDGKTDSTALAKEENPFAGELPDVGREYVMEMGGETYIRRAGYARLARSEGYRLQFDEVVGAHETDWTRSKYRAHVFDETGEQVSEDIGTAGPPENEDMADAESNLDELAATRAATRALAWATGEGLTAVAEVAEQQAERIE